MTPINQPNVGGQLHQMFQGSADTLFTSKNLSCKSSYYLSCTGNGLEALLVFLQKNVRNSMANTTRCAEG